MSAIVGFYRGRSPDSEGRYLRDFWSWSDEELEAAHDFIQWMFPLPEPSRFNPHAPLLSREDVAAFHNDSALREGLRASFRRILSFLGLKSTADSQVVRGDNFEDRLDDVWAAPNHNWMRITRILRSLMLLGLESEARALYVELERLHRSRRLPIGAETFRYWTCAVESPESN